VCCLRVLPPCHWLTSTSSRNTKEYAAVNLDRLQHWIDQGRLVSTPGQPITARELLLSGCVHDVKDGIKILGDVCMFLTFARLAGQAFYRERNSFEARSMWSLPVRPNLRSQQSNVWGVPSIANTITPSPFEIALMVGPIGWPPHRPGEKILVRFRFTLSDCLLICLQSGIPIGVTGVTFHYRPSSGCHSLMIG